jgi:hypothetical protein
MSPVPKRHARGSNSRKEMTMKIIAAALLAVSVLTSMASPGIADDEPWTAERFWEELSRRQF